jgi:hypothetical protein
VTGKAWSHLRRKKITVRAALAGGAAAVTAVAVVAAPSCYGDQEYSSPSGASTPVEVS